MTGKQQMEKFRPILGNRTFGRPCFEFKMCKTIKFLSGLFVLTSVTSRTDKTYEVFCRGS